MYIQKKINEHLKSQMCCLFVVVLTVMKSVRFCQVYLSISFFLNAVVQHPVFTIVGCIYLHPFPFFGVSGNVHTWIVKVLAAVCALDHFAKAWLFAVQTFDLFCQVRVFAAADKFWEEVVHEERFSLGKSFL